MYSQMHEAYKKQLAFGNDLLIIGYSYGDPHINEELIKLPMENGTSIINLNPRDVFPFDAPAVDIKHFNEL